VISAPAKRLKTVSGWSWSGRARRALLSGTNPVSGRSKGRTEAHADRDRT